MAPRRSTRARKPIVTTFDFDGSDAEESETPRTKKFKRAAAGDDDDEAFEAPAAEDDADNDDEDQLPEEASDSPSDAASDVPRRALPGRDKRPQAPTTDPNVIEQYPFSKKTTRAYEGPLKRQRKTPYILEYMYGPEEAHTALACGMLNRWYGLDVQPGRAVDDEQGPMKTPWVKERFEREQMARLAEWRARCDESGVASRQRMVEMTPGDAEDYVCRPKGDMAVLLGPYGDQDEVIFRGGENKALAVDDYDLPTSGGDDEPGTPNGWVFDAGGLVPSLSWAPLSESGPQYLAICVLPHSDQDHPNTAERDAHLGSRKRGTIQIWKFTGSRTEAGEMVPTAKPPVLVRTLCFDWGRARRVKWCPVPSADDSVLGTLAILTGDGRVRVLEIPTPAEDEMGAHGMFHRWPFRARSLTSIQSKSKNPCSLYP